jgi:hypothetical protein
MILPSSLLSSATRFTRQKRSTAFYLPDFINETQKRYEFWEAPQKVAEVHPEGGPTRFQMGRNGGAIISKFEIHDAGLLVEGIQTTDSLDRFLDDFVMWSASEFGVIYNDSQPVRSAYMSGLEVQLDRDAMKFMRIFEKLCSEIQAAVEGQGFAVGGYSVGSLSFQTDESTSRPFRPGRFLLERRVGHPYDSGLFFSEAPVQTDKHIELLQMFDG